MLMEILMSANFLRTGQMVKENIMSTTEIFTKGHFLMV